MTVFTERVAIRQRIEEIKAERRQLNQEYHELLNRLQVLDAKDREAVDTEALIQSLIGAVGDLKQLIPHVPVETVLQHIAENSSDIQVNLSNQENERQVAPSHVISQQQRQDVERVVTYSKTARTDRGYLFNIILDVLKSYQQPVKLSVIHLEVKEKLGRPYSEKALSQTMRALLESNERVQKPARGYYQYKF